MNEETLLSLSELGHFAEVRAIFEIPLKHHPETLLLGLAQVQTQWNTLRQELVSLLLPMFIASHAVRLSGSVVFLNASLEFQFCSAQALDVQPCHAHRGHG